jgi:8-oxo-dGTP pyrophosphatase MutT (NUDIX family)
MPRKIFDYNNLNRFQTVDKLTSSNAYEHSISAGGCLFYKIDDRDELSLLLIQYEKGLLLDDFGGKVDNTDETIFDTIIRETQEETNNVIKKNFIINEICMNNFKTFYHPYSKYFLILIQVKDDFYPDTNIFGKKEQHENIKRTVHWFNFNENRNRLAHRLKNNVNLMKYLTDIQKI